MSIGHWWNDTAKYKERNLSHCQFIYQKSHMDGTEMEPEPARYETDE